jgi:hypothetical protein
LPLRRQFADELRLRKKGLLEIHDSLCEREKLAL